MEAGILAANAGALITSAKNETQQPRSPPSVLRRVLALLLWDPHYRDQRSELQRHPGGSSLECLVGSDSCRLGYCTAMSVRNHRSTHSDRGIATASAQRHHKPAEPVLDAITRFRDRGCHYDSNLRDPCTAVVSGRQQPQRHRPERRCNPQRSSCHHRRLRTPTSRRGGFQ